MPKLIADYNFPITVRQCYANLFTHHFFLFQNFIKKKIHSSRNRIHVSLRPQKNQSDLRPRTDASAVRTSLLHATFRISATPTLTK